MNDRTILSAKIAAGPDIDAPEEEGRFVHLALDPADEAATVFGADMDKAAEIAVEQVAPLALARGGTVVPTERAVLNTHVRNLVVDDFQPFRFTDTETGLILDYNLYIPEGPGPLRLVTFLHDAGVTGPNPRRVLQQGLGAVAFASPADQARHPAFVLAPQFPVALANDAGQTSVYVDMLPRLLEHLAAEYPIDRDRLYVTGQSGGCMSSIALNLAHTDLFAATFCMAGQWDAGAAARLAGANFWAVVSEDDTKAFSGIGAIMEAIAAEGGTVAHGILDAKAAPQAMEQAVAAIRTSSPEAQVFFTPFVAGSVLPEGGAGNAGAGHVNTWVHAYAIPAIREWMFEQRR